MNMKFIFELQRFAFGGGDGSEGNPYIISSTEQLNELSTNVNNGNGYSGKYFRLDGDLDYSGKTFTTIGNTANGNAHFAGIFDGNGKKISNITGAKGLFRNLKGTVKNLTVENFVSGTSSDFNVGAIACTTLNGAKIQNCHVTGESVIAGNSYVGGIVGEIYDSAEISGCTIDSSVKIKAIGLRNRYIGGIVGMIQLGNSNYTATVSNCKNGAEISISNVYGMDSVGGIVGCITNDSVHNNSQINLSNCYYLSHSNPSGGIVAGIGGETQRFYGKLNLTDNYFCVESKETPAFAFTYDENGKYTNNPTGTAQIYRIYYAEGLSGTVTGEGVIEFCGDYYALKGTTVTRGDTIHRDDGYDTEGTIPTSYTVGDEDIVIGKDNVYQWKGTIESTNATWEFVEKDSTLTISGGNILDFQPGTPPWYRFKDKIVNIKIGEGVTHIGNYAFYDLSKLSHIEGNTASIDVADRTFDLSKYCKIELSQSATVTVPDSGGRFICQFGDKIFIEKRDIDYPITLKFDLGEGKHLKRINLANEYYYADSEGNFTFYVPNKSWMAYLEEYPTIGGINFSNGEYQISSAEDLKSLAAYVKEGNTCEGLNFKLTAAIEMKNVTDFLGIGDSTHAFKGSLDGGNFTISNLNISGNDYVGLIANGEGATVKNLTLLNPVMTGTQNANIGAVIGFGKNSTIENCNVVDANISASSEGLSLMKGVVVGVGGTIKNCLYSGNVELCGSSNSNENNKKLVEITFSAKYSNPSITCADEYKKTFDNKTFYVEGASVTLNLTVADNYQNEFVATSNSLTVGTSDISVDVDFVTESGAYVIKSVEGLKLLAEKVNAGNSYDGKTFKLANTIDCNGATLTAIGNAENIFKGTFDGENFTVKNFTISGNDYVGLFGNNGGTIKNLTLDNCTISGANYVGGLVGNNSGTIENCKLNDEVKINTTADNSNWHGGIAGNNFGTIKDCATSATLNLNDKNSCNYFGNISGDNSGNINNCLVFASVAPKIFEITNPLATGTVSNTLSTNGTYKIILPTDENVVVTSNGTNYEGKLFINPDDTFTVSFKGEHRKFFKLNTDSATLNNDGSYTFKAGESGEILDLTGVIAPLIKGTFASGLSWEYDFDKKILSIGTNGNGAMDDYSDENPPSWYAYKDEIKQVEIYGNVTKIGANAFKNLSKVTSENFYIEGSIQREVGDDAFTGTSIKTVQLPPHAMPIEGHILFSGSTESNDSGVKAYISGDTLNYAFLNGYRPSNYNQVSGGTATFAYDGHGLTLLSNISGDITINDTVTQTEATNVIGEGLTYFLGDLSGKTDSYEYLVILGNGAMTDFESADSRPDEIKNQKANIKTIHIGEGVTHIGAHAFDGMTNLTEIVIKSPNVTIDPSAFSGANMNVCLVKVPEEVLIDPEGPNSASYKNCKIAGTYSTGNEYGKYIAFDKKYNINLDITTPIGYALVDSNGNSLGRTISLNGSTSTYNLDGTCQKVWEEISNSDGTTYVIKDTAGLQLIADTTSKDTRVWEDTHFSSLDSYIGKNFKLDADIDWYGTIKNFKGNLDGNGHTVKATGSLFNTFEGTIQNLNISSDSTNANFANENGGIIQNCTNSSAITKSDSDNVGGIADTNSGYGEIKNCTNTGAVTGKDNVGGIVGVNNGGKIKNCENSGAVSGTSRVGGIVGNIQSANTSYINSNFNSGEVSGTSYVGGIAGHSERNYYLYKNYYGGSCNVGGVGAENSSEGTDGNGANKGYKVTFTTNIDGVTVELGSTYISVGETLEPTVTKGYNITDLKIGETSLKDGDSYKFTPSGSTTDVIVNATVALNSVNLTKDSPTAEFADNETKTIQVNGENKLNFVTASYGDATVKANFDGDTFKNFEVVKGRIDISADENSKLENINVTPTVKEGEYPYSATDFTGTANDDSVTIGNVTVQSQFYYEEGGSGGVTGTDDKNYNYARTEFNFDGNGGSDDISINDISVVGGSFGISGGTGKNVIKASNVTVSSVTIEGKVYDEKLDEDVNKTIGKGGNFDITGNSDDDIIEIKNINYLVSDYEQEYSKIYGNAGDDSISVVDVKVSNVAELKIDGGYGNDTINIGSVSGSGSVTVDGGEGKDKISVGGGNVYVTGGDYDGVADKITVSGEGTTVEAGESDVITVTENSKSVIKLGEKTVTVQSYRGDATFNVNNNQLNITSQFAGIIEGDDLSFVNDITNNSLGETRIAEIQKGAHAPIFSLDSVNSTITLAPSVTPYKIKIKISDTETKTLEEVEVHEQTTLKAFIENESLKGLQFDGGFAEISSENLRDITLINGANIISTANKNVTAENLSATSGHITIEGSKGKDNNILVNGAEIGSAGVLSISTGEDGNDTILVQDLEVKDGGIIHSFGKGNGNKLFAENIKVSGNNSDFAIANVEGANNTISVDGVTLDNTNSTAQIGNWNSTSETISVNNVSVNGAAMLLVSGGNGDSVSVSDVKITATNDFGVEIYHNGSKKISVNDVSMSSGNFKVKGFGTTTDGDILIEDVTISGGNFDINGDEGNDKINISNLQIGDNLTAYVKGNGGSDTINISGITGNGTLNVEGGTGDDEISIRAVNIYVDGGEGQDKIFVDGENATVKAGINDKITIAKNVSAVLDFGENDFATIQSSSGDVTFEDGKLSIDEGGVYSVDGDYVQLDFTSENKTFTINGHTYTANEHGLTYDNNGVTMFYDGEFDYSNATIADVLGTSASTNWIPISVVENKTAVLPANLEREIYFVDATTYKKYAKLEVTGEDTKTYRLVNVDGNEDVRDVTFDISSFGKEISFEVVEWSGENFTSKNLMNAKIKTSAATFGISGMTESSGKISDVKIGSDGKVITAAIYQVESSTGNLPANQNAYFFNDDDSNENKTFTVNGVTYTTNKRIGVIATADSAKIYNGYAVITSGKTFTDYNGKNISVTGDIDGVSINIDVDYTAYLADTNEQTNYEDFITVTEIEGLDEGATLTYGDKTFKRNGNFILKTEGNDKTLFECIENSADVTKGGYSYVKVGADNVIDLTGEKSSAIYGTTDNYESAGYLAKVEKLDNGNLILNKNDSLTETLKVTIDDGKNLTANFNAEVTATGTVTVNDTAYSATSIPDNKLTILTADRSSTLHGGKINLGNDVTVTLDGNKTIKRTESEESVGLSYENDVIKDFTVTSGTLEVIGTANDDEINISNVKVDGGTVKIYGDAPQSSDAEENVTNNDKISVSGVTFESGTFEIYGGDGNDTISVSNVNGKKAVSVYGGANDDDINVDGNVYVEGGVGADKVTVGGDATVKVDSDDTVTVTKEKSAVIQLDDKSVTVTALDVDAILTFDASELVIAENWKGNVSGNATIQLSTGTFTLNGTTYTSYSNGALTYTADNVIKIFTGELSNVTADKIATTTSTWQTAQIITDTINYPASEENITYINENGITIAQFTADGILTINKDSAANINVTNGNTNLKVIETNADVTFNNQNIIGGANKIQLTKGTVKIDDKDISIGENADGVIIEIKDGKATSITGLDNGETVTFNNKTYERIGDKIFSEGKVYSVTDKTNILDLGTGTNFVTVENEIDLTNINVGTVFIDAQKNQVASYTSGKLTIDSGTFTVKASGNVTIGETSYNSDGTLEISASKDSSSIINGTLIVTDEQFGLKVANDSDGVNVTFANSAITSITGLSDGGTVEYNGKTYTRNGNYIFSEEKVYTVEDVTNILNLGTGTKFVTVENVIDLSDISEHTFFFKDSAQIAEYNDGSLTINDGSYKLKTSGVKIGGKNISSSSGVTVTIENNVVQSISGLSDGGSVEYDGVIYKRTGNEVTKTINDKDTLHGVTDTTNLLTLTGDGLTYEKLVSNVINLNGKNIIYGTEENYSADKSVVSVNYAEGGCSITKGAAFDNQELTFNVTDKDLVLTTNFVAKITSTGNVTVNNIFYNSKGTLTISTTADSSTLYNGTITVTDKQEGVEVTGGNGVEVTVTNGVIKSITGIDNGETVTLNNKTYERIGDKIFSEGKFYDANTDINILTLGEGTNFVTVDKEIDLTNIDADTIFFNTNKTAQLAEYKGSVLKINDGTLTVKTSSSVTIGNVNYNATSAIELSANKDSSSVINGTVIVIDEQFGVKVENDSNGVNVKFENGVVTSITNVNGTVTYDNKTYTREGDCISIDDKIYTLDDSTNILNLTGGTKIVTVDNEIDLTNISEHTIFFKDSSQIAEYNEGVLTVRDGEYKIKTKDSGVSIGGKNISSSNEVTVTIENGAIKSITGLAVGNSLTYDGKIFTRNETYLSNGEDCYIVDDTSNLLSLTNPFIYIDASDGVIDITKAKVGDYHNSLTIAKAFKDGTQIAEYQTYKDNRFLNIYGEDYYTVKSDQTFKVGHTTFTPVESELFIKSDGYFSYVMDGTIELDGEIKLPHYETVKFAKDNDNSAPVTVTVEDGNIIKNVDVQNGYLWIEGSMAINDTLTLENIMGNGRVTVDALSGDNVLNVGGNVYVYSRMGNDKINITGDGVTVRANERAAITYGNQTIHPDQGYAEILFVTADGLLEPKGPFWVSGDTLSNFMLGSDSKIGYDNKITIVDSAIKDSFNLTAQNKSSVINLKNVQVAKDSIVTISGGTADDTISLDNVKGEGWVTVNGGGGNNSLNIVGSNAAISLASGDRVTLDDSQVILYFGKLEKYDVERYGKIIADGKSAGIDDPVILEVHDDYIQILGGTGQIIEAAIHEEYNFLRDKNGIRIIDLYTNSQLMTMPISKGVAGNYVNITETKTPYVFENKPNEGQLLLLMNNRFLSNIIAEENVTVTLEDGLNFSGKGSVNLDNKLFNGFGSKLKLRDGMQLRVADTDPLNIKLEDITVDGGDVTFTGTDSVDSIFAKNIFVNGAVNFDLKGGNDSVTFDNATISTDLNLTYNYAALKNSSINGNITISGGSLDDKLVAENVTGKNVSIIGDAGADDIFAKNITGDVTISGGDGNDTIRVENNNSEKVASVYGGTGNDSIMADGKVYIEGGIGADNLIVGGGATVKTDSDDTVTVKGKSSAFVNNTTIENLSDITATYTGNNEITFSDGWKGTINGNVAINLPEGTFTLNGTTYTNKDGKLTYTVGDETFTYTSSSYLVDDIANAENWRSNVIHIIVDDGVIPLADIREKTTFEKSDGTVIGTIRDGLLKASGVTLIDATNFNESLIIDKSLLNVDIKTDDGTYQVDSNDNVTLSGGNLTGANSITVKAGNVTAENGVTVKTKGITSTKINDIDFHFDTDSEFVVNEKSVLAINGTFNVSSTLKLQDNSITVKKSNVKVNVENGLATSIIGLTSGGSVEYNGKTYERKGNNITLNRITYDIDDATNLLTIVPVDTYTKITDTINLTNAKDGDIFAINDEQIVAYLKIENGKPILTKGPYIDDVNLNIDTGNYSEVTADFAALVNTKGTATVNGISYNSTGGALTIQTSPESSSLYNGTVSVIGSMNMINVKNVVTKDDSDGVVVTFTNGNATSITGLSEGGSVSYNGTVYTRKDNLVLYRYMAYTVDDSTNILDLKNGNSYIQITDTIDFTQYTATTDMLFGLNDVAVAKSFVRSRKRYVEMYNEDAITIKSSGTININGVDYVSDSALELSANKNSSSIVNGTLIDGSKYTTYIDGELTDSGFLLSPTNPAVALEKSELPNKIIIKDSVGNTVQTYSNIQIAEDSTFTATFSNNAFNKLQVNGRAYIKGDGKISVEDILLNGTGDSFGIEGGAGDDDILIGNIAVDAGTFKVNGNDGADKISVEGVDIGTDGVFEIYGGAGNDTISVDDSAVYIDGGDGSDTIIIGSEKQQSADLAEEILNLSGEENYPTIEADSSDVVTVQENHGAVIKFIDQNYTIQSAAGDITFTGGAVTFSDGTFTINGKTYTRNGNYIFLDGKAYACNDNTDILSMTGGVDYVEVTDSIDVSKLSSGMLIFDAQKNPVATYDGTTLKVTDDIFLTSIIGLPDGGSVEYNGVTYTRNGNKIYADGKVYDIDDTTNILSLDSGTSFTAITNTIDLTNVDENTSFVKNNVEVANYDHDEKKLSITVDGEYTVKTSSEITIGKTKYSPVSEIEIKATKDSSSVINGTISVTDNNIVTNDSDGVQITYKDGQVVSITGLSDGGTLDFDGKSLTRNGNKISIDGKEFTITDNTNLYIFISGNLAPSDIVNNTINLTNAYDGEEFKLNGKTVATLKVEDDGTYTLTAGEQKVDGLIINAGDVQKISTTLQATVKSNGSITVNGKEFNSTGSSLTTEINGSNVNLIDGWVIVTEYLTTGRGGEMKVSTDADGVLVYVESGVAQSITGLNVGGTVTYNGKTYTHKGNKLSDGTKTFIGDESVNLLDLENLSEVVFVEGNILTLKGVKDGSTVCKDGVDIATVSVSDSGYTLTKLNDAANSITIDANNITEVSTDFDAIIKTSANVTVNGVEFSPANSKLTIESKDGKVYLRDGKIFMGDTLTTSDGKTFTKSSGSVTATFKDGVLTKFRNLKGEISGDFTTEISVNEKPVKVEKDTLIAIESTDGNNYEIKDFSDGAVLTNRGNAQKVITDDSSGIFTIGDEKFTISSSSDVAFQLSNSTSKNTVVNVSNLNGTLKSSKNPVTVNGYAFEVSNTNASIKGETNGQTSLFGLTDGDSVTVSSGGAVQMPGTSETDSDTALTVNGKPYLLAKDMDGVIINSDVEGNDSIIGLAKDASLKVGAAGVYYVNGESLNASVGAVIIGDEKGSAYVWDEKDFNIDKNTSVPDIVQMVGGNTEDRYTEKLDSEGAAKLAAQMAAGDLSEANGNMEIAAANIDPDTTQNFDFSKTTGTKQIELEGGIQDVTYNDEGKNIAIIPNTPANDDTAEKNVTFGNGGDIGVVEDVDSLVNFTFGEGGDLLITKGKNVTAKLFKARNTTMNPLEGKLTAEDYDAEKGQSFQTNDDDITDAFKNGNIEANDDSMTMNNGAQVEFKDSSSSPDMAEDIGSSADVSENIASSADEAPNSGSRVVNFMNTKGETTRVGYTYSGGGSADLSNYNGNALLMGNYTDGGAKSKSGTSNLYGGSGTNDFLAGANDNVYLGTGKNNVSLDENRSEGSGGANIYAYDEVIMPNGPATLSTEGGYNIGDRRGGYDSSKISGGDETITGGGGSTSSSLAGGADLADDTAQSADATGSKTYSTIVEGFQFGFDDNNDVLHISGTSSSRKIKQNYIEPLKEMFNSLVNEINEQENSTEESADLAESAMLVTTRINKNSLKVNSILRPSIRNVDLISQAVIGVNTPELSTQLKSLQETLSKLKIKPLSIDTSTSKAVTSTTNSTPVNFNNGGNVVQIQDDSTKDPELNNSDTDLNLPDSSISIVKPGSTTENNSDKNSTNNTTSTSDNNSDKNSTNNTTSTSDNNSDKNSTDNTTSTTDNNSDKNSTTNATSTTKNNSTTSTTTLDYNQWFDKYEVDVYRNFDCAEYAADFYQFMRADGRRYLQYGFGTTTGSWRNYWYSEEKKEQFIQQLMQQYQAEGLPERWAERAWAKKKNIEMSILKDALEDKNNYDSFSTQWQSWTFPIEDLVAALEQSKKSEKWTKNFNSYQRNYLQEIAAVDVPTVEVTQPSVKDAVPEVKKSNKGGVTYKDSVQLKSPDKSASSGDAATSSDLGNVDYTKLRLGYEDGVVKTAIAGEGAVINIETFDYERAEEYVGNNSGIDVGKYDGTVAINLNTGVGVLDGEEAVIIGGVNKLKAGAGAAMFVGSADVQNTLMGGAGDSSIWGGGASKDLLIGYSGEDKAGSTKFFYVKGDSYDTIRSFAYLTSANADTADEINFLENSVTGIKISDSDVYLTVEDDNDVLKVEGALGKDFKVRNNYTAVTAQIGTDRLTYNGRANYFYAAGKNATLQVDSSLYNAEVLMNGANGEYYTGDIKVLDAAQVEGRTTLAGNNYDNVIKAGKGGSILWGGNGGNDTLIGGEGEDNFLYIYGNGADKIDGASANDTVYLKGVTMDQISGFDVNSSAVKINFKDGGSLTVNGDTSGLQYKLEGGTIYSVNQITREWTQK